MEVEMKGIVVYQSWWGSCRTIAEAIARGLKDSGHEAQVIAVEDAGDPDPSLDFIAIGGATRWPGARGKIKRYAKKTVKSGFSGKPFATFSTGGTVLTDEPNTQASEQLYEILEEGGLVPLAPPFKAGMEGYKPPGITRGSLPAAEVARAEQFGRELGAKLTGK
jgi:flavodoxin